MVGISIESQIKPRTIAMIEIARIDRQIQPQKASETVKQMSNNLERKLIRT
ncbi:MAG: hypothetical protein N4J56_007400 [Chroococcidiopsis sp. SAG 2025]|nr:hypothetical protein [Chroococcidiopsis sp. SAG 2025]